MSTGFQGQAGVSREWGLCQYCAGSCSRLFTERRRVSPDSYLSDRVCNLLSAITYLGQGSHKGNRLWESSWCPNTLFLSVSDKIHDGKKMHREDTALLACMTADRLEILMKGVVYLDKTFH